jgi:mono/diheme cytochrome c family protein
VFEIEPGRSGAAGGKDGRPAELLLVSEHLQIVRQRAPVPERDRHRARPLQHDRRRVERVLVAGHPQLRVGGRRDRSAGLILVSAAGDEQRADSEGEGGAAQGQGILCAAVTRPIAIACAFVASAFVGCGGDITVPEQDQTAHRGAVLFYERCSGCHTFEAANAYGSKPAGQLQGGERTNGPNFDVRKESKDDVLFAIRNGGFSGAIMPANIVTGSEAVAVAEFLDKYSGRKTGE